MPGTMVVSQPVVPEPIPPSGSTFPPFATNPDEADADQDAEERRARGFRPI